MIRPALFLILSPVLAFADGAGGFGPFSRSLNVAEHGYRILAAGDLRGRWRRAEVFARWSARADGLIQFHLNGALALERRGANVTAYFADVRKSRTREGLAP